MMEIIVSLMMQAQTKARARVKALCERHLIADNPWPFAEEPDMVLVHAYLRTGSDGILREIEYRIAHGLVSEIEIARLMHIAMDGGEG